MGYKTVTELEWRCCPGYSGENCYDGPTSMPDVGVPPSRGAGLPRRPGVKGYPHGPRPPVDAVPGGGQLEPGRPFPGVPDHRTIPTGQLPAGSGKPNYGEQTVCCKTSEFTLLPRVGVKPLACAPLSHASSFKSARLPLMPADFIRLK